MLTGPDLGRAIESARKLKRVTKKSLAEHFGVEPPSVQDWVKRGTIDKSKLPKLWAYFSDVVGLEHWGMDAESLASGTITLDQALERLGIELASAPPSMREAIASNLAGWARDGGADHWRRIVHGLLTDPQGKRIAGSL